MDLGIPAYKSKALLEASTLPFADIGADGKDASAKNDPIAAQIWKMYTKQRDALPNGARMENLSWRMVSRVVKFCAPCSCWKMAMNLRKKESEPGKWSTTSGQNADSADSLSISPGGTEAIIINGHSPPKTFNCPPASMPAFPNRNEFGTKKTLVRKTSLKVSICLQVGHSFIILGREEASSRIFASSACNGRCFEICV